MKDIEKVLICGIGAVGSIYANLISGYDNKNLRILVDKTRLAKYSKNPKIFNGQKLELNYILPEDKNFKPDLIIIATKYDGLVAAIQNIKNFVGKNTIIMSLLNGVTSEEIIAKSYGWSHIVHSYFIGHSAMRNKNQIIHDGTGEIVFGVKDSRITDKRIEGKLKDYFDKVGISYRIPNDIYRSLWLKYMLNISTNQPSAILGLTFGQMQENKFFINFMKNIMQEVVNIARACGVKNTQTMIEEAMESFYTMIPEGKTSMLQDVESGRITEVSMFAGVIIELGEKYNIDTPYNKVLKQMIDIIDYQSGFFE